MERAGKVWVSLGKIWVSLGNVWEHLGKVRKSLVRIVSSLDQWKEDEEGFLNDDLINLFTRESRK